MPTITTIQATDLISDSRSVINTNFSNLNVGLTSLFYSVGTTGSGAIYITDGTADEVQINQAITAANTAGGGIVYIFPGTYNCAAPVTVLSNVTLRGAGMGVTTFKAIANYYASAGTHSLCRQLSSNSNISIYDITFDGNGQNEANLTIDGSAFTEFLNCSFLRIERCEFKNGVFYTLFIALSNQVWVKNNKVTSGWTLTANTTQQDGIHLSNCTNFWVDSNYVDTYGTNSSASVRNSGDDGIAIQADKATNTFPCLYGVVSNNIIKSGSRGIGLFVDAAEVSNMHVYGNTVIIAQYSGIKLQRVGGVLTGVFRNINISDNTIVSAGALTSGQVEGAAGIEFDHGGNTSLFINRLSLNGNEVILTASTFGTPAGAGIYATGAIFGVSMIDNKVVGVAGTKGIVVGASGYIANRIIISDNYVSVATLGFTCLSLVDLNNSTITSNYLEADGNLGGSFGIKITGVTTCAANTFTGNQIRRVQTGFIEVDGGVAPDYNNIQSNIFATTTTPTTTVGTHSVAANNITAP